MWMLILLVFQLNFQDTPVPFLSSEEYSYEVDFFLKRKPPQEKQFYDVNRKNPVHQDLLPYVMLHFTFLQFREDDHKIIVYKGINRLNTKKIKGPMKITLDMGYSVDLKEGVGSSEFTIMIVDKENEPRARILVEVMKNGEMFINEVSSGMI